MAIPAERLREESLTAMSLGFSKHNDGRITDSSKVCIPIGVAQAIDNIVYLRSS